MAVHSLPRPILPFLAAATVVASSAAVPETPPDEARLHFDLERSVPAADSTVAPPSEVRLWFTQAPQDGSVSIRLVDAASELVPSADPRQDSEDPTSFHLGFEDPLGPGTYTVRWRGMGSDGHVVRDTFRFTVQRP